MRLSTSHPRDETLLDLIEGVAAGDVRAHVGSCATCAARVEEARRGLALAREAEVPEPAPMYWDAFRSQVGTRIAVERRSRLTVLAPLAAAAALAGLVVFLPRPGPQPSIPLVPNLPAWSALPPAEEDSGLAVLSALGPRVEDVGGALDCSDTGDCLAELSDDESRAVASLLSRELPAAALR